MARLKFDVHTRSLSNVSFELLCKEYLTKLSVFKHAGLVEKRGFLQSILRLDECKCTHKGFWKCRTLIWHMHYLVKSYHLKFSNVKTTLLVLTLKYVEKFIIQEHICEIIYLIKLTTTHGKKHEPIFHTLFSDGCYNTYRVSDLQSELMFLSLIDSLIYSFVISACLNNLGFKRKGNVRSLHL